MSNSQDPMVGVVADVLRAASPRAAEFLVGVSRAVMSAFLAPQPPAAPTLPIPAAPITLTAPPRASKKPAAAPPHPTPERNGTPKAASRVEDDVVKAFLADNPGWHTYGAVFTGLRAGTTPVSARVLPDVLDRLARTAGIASGVRQATSGNGGPRQWQIYAAPGTVPEPRMLRCNAACGPRATPPDAPAAKPKAESKSKSKGQVAVDSDAVLKAVQAGDSVTVVTCRLGLPTDTATLSLVGATLAGHAAAGRLTRRRENRPANTGNSSGSRTVYYPADVTPPVRTRGRSAAASAAPGEKTVDKSADRQTAVQAEILAAFDRSKEPRSVGELKPRRLKNMTASQRVGIVYQAVRALTKAGHLTKVPKAKPDDPQRYTLATPVELPAPVEAATV